MTLKLGTLCTDAAKCCIPIIQNERPRDASLFLLRTAWSSAQFPPREVFKLRSMFGVSRRRATTELWPFSTAHTNPVLPVFSFVLTPTPLCKAAFTPSRLPFLHRSTRDMVASSLAAYKRSTGNTNSSPTTVSKVGFDLLSCQQLHWTTCCCHTVWLLICGTPQITASLYTFTVLSDWLIFMERLVALKWEYLPGLSWTLDPFAETINLGGGAKENKRLDEKSLEHKKARWL